MLQTGPGQHIRPAPAWGPGSKSMSGLVDYSNVFVMVSLLSFYSPLTFTEEP